MDTASLSSAELVGALGALVPILSAASKMRSSHALLRTRRTENFTRLLRSDRWRSCHPVLLQLAVEQAFGALLDDREITRTLERHDPVRIFRDRAKTLGIIRWDAESDAYVDERTIKAIP